MVLLITACQSPGPAPTSSSSPVSQPSASGAPAPSPTGTVAASSGPTPIATSTSEASPVEADLESGPGSFYLSDPRAGLDVLSSYTQTLVVTFDGTANGGPQTWSKTYRLRHVAAPQATVLTIEVSGAVDPADPAGFAEAAGSAYEVGADGVCTVRPLDPQDSSLALREPAGSLPSLLGAEAAGSDTTNAVAADHFTFDERAMLEPGIDTAGEIWVATDGGYVVKFLRSTTADAAYFGGGLDGTMAWDYELTDVNALMVVDLPDGCQLDVPLMADASNVLMVPRYTGFDTQASVADAVAFYEQQLPTVGWTLKSEPFTGDDRAAVEFTKANQTLTLIVTSGENGRRVDLALNSGG